MKMISVKQDRQKVTGADIDQRRNTGDILLEENT